MAFIGTNKDLEYAYLTYQDTAHSYDMGMRVNDLPEDEIAQVEALISTISLTTSVDRAILEARRDRIRIVETDERNIDPLDALGIINLWSQVGW